jgi:hypothetical protein
MKNTAVSYGSVCTVWQSMWTLGLGTWGRKKSYKGQGHRVLGAPLRKHRKSTNRSACRMATLTPQWRLNGKNAKLGKGVYIRAQWSQEAMGFQWECLNVEKQRTNTKQRVSSPQKGRDHIYKESQCHHIQHMNLGRHSDHNNLYGFCVLHSLFTHFAIFYIYNVPMGLACSYSAICDNKNWEWEKLNTLTK